MSENLEYWLWLQRALGEGAFIKEIISDFKSVKNLYNANILELRMSPALTAKQISKIEETDINSVSEIIYSCRQNGWQMIDYDDEKYPKRLKEINNPPAVLYVDGSLPDIDDIATVAIVGTRKASEYAVRVTNVMSRGITEAGALVVSGGALGVDSAAHKGALLAGGKTVAVMGCGLGSNYLNENKSLRQVIRENGALVTEYPPFSKATRYSFPLRNRIISGLSLGVLVVEAGVKSGSLITANYALEQGRDVFAIPGSVLSLDFAGTNRLIDDGATVVTKPEHIVCSYASMFDSLDLSKVRGVDELMNDCVDKNANIEQSEDKLSFDNLENGRKKRLKNEEAARTLKGDAATVYEALEESFLRLDDIMAKTGLSSAKVLAALTQLEIRGLAESTSGRRYKQS